MYMDHVVWHPRKFSDRNWYPAKLSAPYSNFEFQSSLATFEWLEVFIGSDSAWQSGDYPTESTLKSILCVHNHHESLSAQKRASFRKS